MILILAFLVIGMAAGWLAQFILGGRGRADWTEATIAGLAGSFVGGLLSSLLAGDGLAVRPSGLIGSVVGAIIVLAVWRFVRSRRG